MVRVSPPATPGGEPQIRVDHQLHIFDRYNWDKGKAVGLGPIEVTDEQLQELHRAGLAREYEIHGSSSSVSSSRDLPHPGEAAGGDPPQAGEREGGRADPGRDRGPSRSRR